MATTPITPVRLDGRAKAELSALAQYHNLSESDIIRMAITAMHREMGKERKVETLAELAHRRFENTPELAPYEDMIFADWPNMDEHLSWIITAPAADIVDWAEAAK
jgi:hypothetical protein